MDLQHPAAGTFQFGVFELDARSGELRRHGQKVRLPHQSFQILLLLLSRPGDMVTRDELRQALWTSETFVDFDVGLNSAIRKLREALDEDAAHPRFIETLPRRGYRFIAPVQAIKAIEPAPLPAPAHETVLPSTPLPTPIPRRRIRTIWIGAAVALVVAVALGAAYARSRQAASDISSIAVLPFENLSGDTAQGYFADAVTDAVTTHLAQVPDVEVVSRTSAKLSKQPDARISAIASALHVDAVLEGTVARSGDHVRITAQLVRGATERHLWARSYEGEISRIFSLQQRIAEEIAAAIGRQPLAQRGVRAGRVVDPKAYDAYLKGVTASGLQRYDGFRTAVGYFEQAIAQQPDFAEAHAALAQSQLQFLFGGPLSPREVIPKAEAAARRAIELDPTMPVPHQVLGQILSLFYWKWDEADASHARAAALWAQRNDVPRGGVVSIRKDQDADAIARAERARNRDPLSFALQMNVGVAYRASSQYDRAIAELQRALEITPGSGRALFQLGVTYVMMRRFDEAIREFDAAVQALQGRNPRFEAYRAYAYAMAGRPLEARRILHDLEARRLEEYVSSFGIALIYDALGEKEASLTALERACEERAVEFGQPRQYPPFKTIASEPRFEAVMHRVGLP
jgi:TolB-like protein/DNA-binding winged helix-turn-helix (wHTH) protein